MDLCNIDGSIIQTHKDKGNIEYLSGHVILFIYISHPCLTLRGESVNAGIGARQSLPALSSYVF